MRRQYTGEELKILNDYYITRGAKWVSERLGRSLGNIKHKARVLGIARKQSQGVSRRWNSDELLTIQREYPIVGPTRVALLLGRSIASIRAKAVELGLHRDNWKWSDDEVAYLSEHLHGYRQLLRISEVLGRSPDAVWLKARQVGLSSAIRPKYVDGVYKRKWINPKLCSDVYVKCNGKCSVCGKSTSEVAMEVHHIIPYRIVKEHKLENLTLLCIDCHVEHHKMK
jgi:5-methylcytosine-specific restriction endonuclease McrA